MSKYTKYITEYFPNARPSSLPTSMNCGTIEADNAEEALGVFLIDKGISFETIKFSRNDVSCTFTIDNKEYSAVRS